MDDRKYKLLIVDDSKAILRAVADAFADLPRYEVKTTTNPVEALRLIEQESFNIVVTDVQMPEMNGLDLLRQIKHYNGMIQVVVITGHITINNVLNAYRYGAATLFFKPFKIPSLKKAVNECAARLDHVNVLLQEVASAKGY